MLTTFVADNEHGRAVLALIRAIRACGKCLPALYITCHEHPQALATLYPDGCADPACPACAE